MKKILLLIFSIILFTSCEKEEIQPEPKIDLKMSVTANTTTPGKASFSPDKNNKFTISYNQSGFSDIYLYPTITPPSGLKVKTVQLFFDGKLVHSTSDLKFSYNQILVSKIGKTYDISVSVIYGDSKYATKDYTLYIE